MYTDSTNTSTRSKIALAASVASAPPNEASLLALLATLPSMLCSAVLPCLTSFRWMPWWSSSCLQGRDRFVGFVDDVRKVVAERAHLIGDRVGQQEADAGERRKNARYTASTASPRGRRERCRKATAGLRISAMSPAMMKITSTLPAAFASAHSASSASGSSTSCTQRGTTTRAGAAGASGDPAASGVQASQASQGSSA